MNIDIILITYNQEKYIQKAIEGLFLQSVGEDTSVRVVVADDHSTDSTYSIIRAISRSEKGKRYEWTFLPEEGNMGNAKNYQRAFAACTGDYVAILEGDDWWCSPIHLARSIDFLNEHPDFVAVGSHPVFYYDEDQVFAPETMITSTKVLDTDSLLRQSDFENLSTIMIRTDALGKLDSRIFNTTILDWSLYINLSRLGKLGVLPMATSVYRYNKHGIWSGNDEAAQKELVNKMLKEMNEIFPEYEQLLLTPSTSPTHKSRLKTIKRMVKRLFS